MECEMCKNEGEECNGTDIQIRELPQMGMEYTEQSYPKPSPTEKEPKKMACWIERFNHYIEMFDECLVAAIDYALEPDYWGDYDDVYYYHGSRDWYENNRDAIETESWVRQEWEAELKWYREQLTIETNSTILESYKIKIRELEKALGSYKGEKKY